MNSTTITTENTILFNEEINTDITVAADGVIIRGCKINGSIYIENAANCLIAQNDVVGDISAKGAYNSVILLNKAKSINAANNTNIYIVENSVIGVLTLKSNSYLLADENICTEILSEGNEGFNGDNITDVDARLAHGADVDLLPHANKDLFVGMERKKHVADSNEGVSAYIMSHANGGIVIVPPGAYEACEPIKLSEGASGSTIYAYGALMELIQYGNSFVTDRVSSLTLKGLVIGYAGQPCGQITLIDEIDDGVFLAVPYAGGADGFGKTDPSLFSSIVTDMFEEGKIYPWGLIGGAYTIEKEGDRLYRLTVNPNFHLKDGIHKGDRFVCRLAEPNKISISLYNSKNILIKDSFLYCHSACLALVAGGTSENIRLYRWYNGNEAARIIDKETYDYYHGIEKTYGISGEVYIDSLGRYRGGTPLICSADATHITGSKKGVDATSCLFESMCDDGSNQHATSSRLAGVEDNRDGTSTVYYKGSVAQVYCCRHFNVNNPKPRPSACPPISKGDRVLIYTGTGITLCDTRALSDSEAVEDYEFDITPQDYPTRHYYDTVRKFIVATDAINMAAIDGFDLSDNHYDIKNKVLVDNLSRNSAGFSFDNVMVRNTRSRGILVKTVDADIDNCTFQNLGHTGVLLSVEFVWGESSVSQNVNIRKCLFDNVGFINRGFSNKTISPIAIKGLSSTVSEESLLYKNILIDGNKFINNQNDHAVTVNSAQGVRIINNVFDESVGEYDGHSRPVIDIETSMNIEISNNKYSKYLADINQGITATNFKNIYGGDIVLVGDID